MVRSYTNNQSRSSNNNHSRHVYTPRAPQFINRRPTIHYDHLPRHSVSITREGSLSDRIGWVLLHEDLTAHVEARLRDIPNALTTVAAYRALARAVPSYSMLKLFVNKAGAPKSDKKAAGQLLDEAHFAAVQAAEQVIILLANPTVARALHDLLPLRNQHSGWNTNLWRWGDAQPGDLRRFGEHPGAGYQVDEVAGSSSNEDLLWPPTAETDPWASTAATDGNSSNGITVEGERQLSPITEESSLSDELPALEGLTLSMVDEEIPQDDNDDDDEMSEDDDGLVVVIPPTPSLTPDSSSSLLSFSSSSSTPPLTPDSSLSSLPSSSPPPYEQLVSGARQTTCCRLRRGPGSTRLVAITPHASTVFVANCEFPLTLDEVKTIYLGCWPNATADQVDKATLFLDDLLARQYNCYSIRQRQVGTSFLLEVMPYRRALEMTDEEGSNWTVGDEARADNQAFAKTIVQYTSHLLLPTALDGLSHLVV